MLDEGNLMRLKWYGHACFHITPDDGPTIVTDPYAPDVAGYRPIRDSAVMVIRSSPDDRYHCRADLVPGEPIVVDALAIAAAGGQRDVMGVPIRAMGAREDLHMEHRQAGVNAMYRFTVDDLHIAHMGDVGNPLTPNQRRFFEGIDVLLALAGGPPNLPLDDLMALIDEVQPALVIPMHFRTLRCKLTRIEWLPAFLDYWDEDAVDFAFSETVTITPEALPDATRLLVLDYV